MTQVLAGTLTAGSIVQSTLLIGSEAGMSGAHQTTVFSKENLLPVPEPESLLLLLLAGLACAISAQPINLIKNESFFEKWGSG